MEHSRGVCAPQPQHCTQAAMASDEQVDRLLMRCANQAALQCCIGVDDWWRESITSQRSLARPPPAPQYWCGAGGVHVRVRPGSGPT